MARLEDLFDDQGQVKVPGSQPAPSPPAQVTTTPEVYKGGLKTLKIPLPAAPTPFELVKQDLAEGLAQQERLLAQPPEVRTVPVESPGAHVPPPWIESAPQPAPQAEAGEVTVQDLLKQPFTYLSGAAGTGKTWLARQVLKERPDSTLFCATTGIAAVNLGDAVTINGALAYFDTKSLMEHYASGFLQYRLRMLRRSGVRILLVDEISMMEADQLTILCQAIDELDQKKMYDQDLEQVYWSTNDDGRLRLLLVGDFAQLPPIKAPFAFESPEWGRFQRYTLTKIRRQGDAAFVQALQAVRRGLPQQALDTLRPRFVPSLDFDFKGTTIVPKNDAVDRINNLRYAKLAGQEFGYSTIRSGEQEKEWIKQIPERVNFKKGALVMVLANKPLPKLDEEDITSGYYYVNGDLATVIEADPNGIRVMLHRTFADVVVTPAVKEKKEATGKKNPRWLIKGTVTYMPLRLAYATTVHKSQGLSLDEVQISIIDGFFSAPGMMYVALSRARTLEGLRIVGNPQMFLGRCGMDRRIEAFL